MGCAEVCTPMACDEEMYTHVYMCMYRWLIRIKLWRMLLQQNVNNMQELYSVMDIWWHACRQWGPKCKHSVFHLICVLTVYFLRAALWCYHPKRGIAASCLGFIKKIKENTVPLIKMVKKQKCHSYLCKLDKEIWLNAHYSCRSMLVWPSCSCQCESVVSIWHVLNESYIDKHAHSHAHLQYSLEGIDNMDSSGIVSGI